MLTNILSGLAQGTVSGERSAQVNENAKPHSGVAFDSIYADDAGGQNSGEPELRPETKTADNHRSAEGAESGDAAPVVGESSEDQPSDLASADGLPEVEMTVSDKADLRPEAVKSGAIVPGGVAVGSLTSILPMQAVARPPTAHRSIAELQVTAGQVSTVTSSHPGQAMSGAMLSTQANADVAVPVRAAADVAVPVQASADVAAPVQASADVAAPVQAPAGVVVPVQAPAGVVVPVQTATGVAVEAPSGQASINTVDAVTANQATQRGQREAVAQTPGQVSANSTPGLAAEQAVPKTALGQQSDQTEAAQSQRNSANLARATSLPVTAPDQGITTAAAQQSENPVPQRGGVDRVPGQSNQAGQMAAARLQSQSAIMAPSAEDTTGDVAAPAAIENTAPRSNEMLRASSPTIGMASQIAAAGGLVQPGQPVQRASQTATQRVTFSATDSAPVAEVDVDFSASSSSQIIRQTQTAAVLPEFQAGNRIMPLVNSQTLEAEAETRLGLSNTSLSLDPIFGESTSLSQLLTEAAISPGTAHRPETPRLVAAQLAEALATKGERNINVVLNPEELGRVGMRVSTTESAVTVMITTERPETGEMMRRHISELADEFRRMGFEDISFEFSGEGMSGQMADGTDQGESSSSGSAGFTDDDTMAEITPEPVQQNLRLGDTGLDMRM